MRLIIIYKCIIMKNTLTVVVVAARSIRADRCLFLEASVAVVVGRCSRRFGQMFGQFPDERKVISGAEARLEKQRRAATSQLAFVNDGNSVS